MFQRVLHNTMSGIQLLFLKAHKEKEVVKLIGSVRRERSSRLSTFECFQLFALARAQSAQVGDMAEVGACRGATARLICEAKGNRTLHLFEQTSPHEVCEYADDTRGEEHRAGIRESLSAYLKGYKNVCCHQDLLGDSVGLYEQTQFSFVHLAIDFGEGVLVCLEHFYPRMVPGGVLLSHHYSTHDGVKRTIDDFAARRSSLLVELPSTQCMVVKL